MINLNLKCNHRNATDILAHRREFKYSIDSLNLLMICVILLKQFFFLCIVEIGWSVALSTINRASSRQAEAHTERYKAADTYII